MRSLLYTILLLLLLDPKVEGQSTAVFFSNANNGSWTSSGSWSVTGPDSDGLPDANDSIVIRNGHVIFVSGTQSCKGISFAASVGIDSSTLVILSGAQLSVAGPINMIQGNTRHMLLSVLGSLTTTGALTMGHTGGTGINLVSIGSAGSADIGGLLKLDNSSGLSAVQVSGNPSASPTGYLECDSLAMVQTNDAVSNDNLLHHPATVKGGTYLYIPQNAIRVNTIQGNLSTYNLTVSNASVVANTITGTTTVHGNLSASVSGAGSNYFQGSVSLSNGSISVSTSGNGGNRFTKNLTATQCTGFSFSATGDNKEGCNVVDSVLSVSGSSGNVSITATNDGDADPFLIVLAIPNNLSNLFYSNASFSMPGTFTMQNATTVPNDGSNVFYGNLSLSNFNTVTMTASRTDNIVRGTLSLSAMSAVTFRTEGSTSGSNKMTGQVSASNVQNIYLTAESDGSNQWLSGASLSLINGLTLQTASGNTYKGDNYIAGTLNLTTSSGGLTLNAYNDGINLIDGAVLNLAGNLTLYNGINFNSNEGLNKVTVTGPSQVGGQILMTAVSLEGQNLLRVYSSLTVNGSNSLQLTSGSSGNHDGTAGADNKIEVGTAGTLGSLTLNSITMASPDAGASPRNQIYLTYGTLDINGNLSLTGNNQLRNQICWNDAPGSGDGYAKTIYLGGTVSGVSSGSLIRDDADNDGNLTLVLDGTTTAQTVPGSDNWQYNRLEIANTYAPVSLSGALSYSSGRLKGTLKLYSGVTLQDNGYGFGGTGNDSLEMSGSSRFIIENLSDAFPANIEYLAASSSAVVEFRNSSASTQLILGGTGAYKKLYSVELSGSGTKEIQHNLSSTAIDIENLHLKGGTVTFATAGTLTFNLRADASATTQTFTADANTTLQIPKNFSAVPVLKFNLNYNSTVKYSGTATQRIYPMYKNSGSGGQLAPLGNITFSGAAAKELQAGDSVKVRRKVSIETGAVLSIGNQSCFILHSDASTTAWVAQVLGSITYTGTGKIVAQRYLSFTSKRYRDISTPIKNATLETWKNAGVNFTGFPGANNPYIGAGINAYKYNEALSGTLDERFSAAADITNAIHTFDGGAIKQGAWRVYLGSAFGKIYTLQDSGQIYTGDVTFKTTFTHSIDSLNRQYNSGYNLVGNPYPCAISWQSIVNDPANTAFLASNGISPTYYQWMPSDNNVGNVVEAYSSYNALTGVSYGNTPINGVIPAFQGFWVKTYHATASSTSYTFTIKESHKADTSAIFLKANAKAVAVTKIVLKDPSGLVTQAGMHFWPNATDTTDDLYDIRKFGKPAQAALGVAFLSGKNVLPLLVNAIPFGQNDYNYPLWISTPAAGIYKVSFTDLDALIGSYDCAELVDESTGNRINLKINGEYSFSSAKNYAGHRFTLRFSRKMRSTDLAAFPSTCKGSNGSIRIEPRITGDCDLTLLQGSKVISRYTGKRSVIKESLPAGTYILIDKRAGACGTFTYTLEIREPVAVIADFIPNRNQVVAGARITFKNLSTGAMHYSWSFGDDLSTSEDANPLHMFLLPGQYNVKLTAWNADPACTTAVIKKITVQNAPPGNLETEKFRITFHGEEIEAEQLAAEIASIEVYAPDGRLVFRKDAIGKTERIAGLKKGSYYLVVYRSGQGVEYKKVYN